MAKFDFETRMGCFKKIRETSYDISRFDTSKDLWDQVRDELKRLWIRFDVVIVDVRERAGSVVALYQLDPVW